jgi:hypothetical protein
MSNFTIGRFMSAYHLKAKYLKFKIKSVNMCHVTVLMFY